MTNWPTVKLGELLVRRGGSVLPASFPDEEFELYSIPAHDRDGYEVLAGHLIGSSKQLVLPGDIMISKIVPHIRRARVVGPRTRWRQIASGEWITFRSDHIDSNYLRHYLLTDAFHAQFMATVAGVGGSLLRARPAAVAELTVPLPLIEEQRRIAAILDHAERILASRRQAVDSLSSLALSVFGAAFSGCAASFPQLPLRELGLVTTGRTPPTAAVGMFDGPVPFITPGDLGSRRAPGRTVSFDGALASRTVRAGSTLVCCIGATIGKVGITNEISAFNQQINAIEWGDAVDDTYGLFAMKALKPTIVARGASTTLPLLPKSKFEELVIPVPPLEEQRKFARVSAAVSDHARVMEEQLERIRALFGSLQARAFSGRL